MSNIFYNLVPLPSAPWLSCWCSGLVNMMRGGSPYTSQKLMRLRVVLQFVALVIIMAALWMMGR